MGSHMRGDRRALRKLATAYLTREWLFTRMCTQMCRQIGRLCERLITSITFVWFFSLKIVVIKNLRIEDKEKDKKYL